MVRFIPNVSSDGLKDKVVVMTGGANGIGAAFVELCCQYGAYVCFGDIDTTLGEQHAQKLCAAAATTDSSKPRALFVKADVTDYQSNLTLFQTALDTYGRIDHAVAVAGIVEIGNWFDPNLDLESIKTEPTRKVLDVNLLGSLYFSRIAAVYLRQNREDGADRSITLISSSAGFKSTPGIPVYQATKHGIIGIMRCLPMEIGVGKMWEGQGLPANTPKDVGETIVGVMCEKGLSGKSMYIEGGRSWEMEDGIESLEPQWLGEEQSKTLNIGQDFLASLAVQWPKN